MGSLGTPSAAALATITFIATITALTSGLVTQCHPVPDTVLDSVLGHMPCSVILPPPPIAYPPARGGGPQTRGDLGSRAWALPR